MAGAFFRSPPAHLAAGDERPASHSPALPIDPWVEVKINPRFNPGADDRTRPAEDDVAMTITDYLINAMFLLLVARQARERELDRRSAIVPLVILFFVAQMFLHSIPTAGNDLVLIGLLAAVGLTLGIASGFATHVRAGANGLAVARVGWLVAGLLVAGIGSRMVFAFAISNGLRPDIASFSIAHHISAAAWPTALVLMAICEVTTRIAIVQLRGRKATSDQATFTATIPATA
jgi:hypothetical protein